MPKNNDQQEESIKLQDGISESEANKIIDEIKKIPKGQIGKDLIDLLDNSEKINRKNFSEAVLNSIKTLTNIWTWIDEDNFWVFNTLLQQIAKLEPDITKSNDYILIIAATQSKENIVARNTNKTAEQWVFDLEEDLIERKEQVKKVTEPWLKSYLEGRVGTYEKLYKDRQKRLTTNEDLPDYAFLWIQIDPIDWIISIPTKDSGKTHDIDMFSIVKWAYKNLPSIIVDKKSGELQLIVWNNKWEQEEAFTIEAPKQPASIDDKNAEKRLWFLNLITWKFITTRPTINLIEFQKYFDNAITKPTASTKEKEINSRLLNNLITADPINKNIYEGYKKSLEKWQTQQKEEEIAENKALNILKSAPTLELANQLFWDTADRLVTNTILEKYLANQLSDSEKDNLAILITLYVQVVDKGIVVDLTKSVKKWWSDGANHRPKDYNWLPVYLIRIEHGTPKKYIEIFPWTEKDIHKARSQALETKSFKSWDNNEIDLTQLWQKDWPSLKDFIDQAHEQGSYEALANIIKNNPTVKDYIIKNIGTVLNDIKTKHKEIDEGKIKNVSPENTNGYYRVIAETIVNTWDKLTIQAYLTHIQSTPSYLGDGQSRIDTRNIIAKRWDANILKSTNPEDKWLQNLYLLIKSQIDPTKAKGDILEQVDANLDKFMETFGPTIAMVVDFLWWKGTFMKMLPAAMRDKFKENFKKNSEMKGKELERFEAIINGFSNISNTPLKKDDKAIIEEVQNGAEWKNIKESLTENFTSLSPSLVYKVIKEYNKNKKPEEQLKAEDFIAFNAKGAPEWVRENVSESQKKIIIDQLTSNTSPMWKDIKNAYEHTKKNSEVDLRTQKEIDKWVTENTEVNINGSETKKGIGSYADVAVYIAAYVSTAGGNTPYHYVISENDKVVTGISHKEGIATDKPNEEQKKLEEEYKQKINTITTEINKKDGNIIPTVFDVSKITTDKATETYVNTILKPLEEALSQKIFKLSADNTDLLTALQSKSQVMKDFVSYIANTKQWDEKTTLQGIADIFKTSDNQLTSIQTIEKSKDTTSIIITVNNKKISISAGPTIAEYKE